MKAQKLKKSDLKKLKKERERLVKKEQKEREKAEAAERRRLRSEPCHPCFRAGASQLTRQLLVQSTSIDIVALSMIKVNLALDHLRVNLMLSARSGRLQADQILSTTSLTNGSGSITQTSRNRQSLCQARKSGWQVLVVLVVLAVGVLGVEPVEEEVAAEEQEGRRTVGIGQKMKMGEG